MFFCAFSLSISVWRRNLIIDHLARLVLAPFHDSWLLVGSSRPKVSRDLRIGNTQRSQLGATLKVGHVVIQIVDNFDWTFVSYHKD